MRTRSVGTRVVATAATSALVIGGIGCTGAAAASPGIPAAMMASGIDQWYLAPSLVALRTEVNLRWPGRDRSSDGWVGDAYHASRTNSHNPVGSPGGPGVGTKGAVHALDITANGINVTSVLRAVVGDSRVWYVIYDRKIWSRTTGWAPVRYTGDPHTTHIHVNLREGSQRIAVAAERDNSRWLSGSSGSTARAAGTSARSMLTPKLTNSGTKALQRALISAGYHIPSGPTGWYGPETTRAVRAFQQAQGWSGSGADGIAGSQTLRRLGVGSAPTATVARTSKKAKKPKSSKAAGASTGTKAGAAKALAGYKPGTASTKVYYLQQALIEKGYDIPAGPTGYFGERTVAAVAAFQRAQGWPASQCDGVPGRKTLSRLGLG